MANIVAELERNPVSAPRMKRYFGADDDLTRYSEIVADIARKTGCTLLDFHTYLYKIDLKVQKIDPQKTIIGLD